MLASGVLSSLTVTHDSYYVVTGFTIHSLLYALFAGCLVYAAVLFFRADRRLHTGILLGGAILKIVGLLWVEIRWRMQSNDEFASSSKIDLWDLLLEGGVNLIGEAMIAYGLVAVALIQFRKSRLAQ